MPATPTKAQTDKIEALTARLTTAGNNHYIGGLGYHLRTSPTMPLWQAMLSALETVEASKSEGYIRTEAEQAELVEFMKKRAATSAA